MPCVTRSTSSALRTSKVSVHTSMPSPPNSSAAASSTSLRRDAMAMRAPWRPNTRAISLPMPVPPPVTKATCPVNRPGWNTSAGSLSGVMRPTLRGGRVSCFLRSKGDTMGRLDGKVAVITGGARGQGEQHVRLFVAEGAKVVFGDVLDDLGDAVAGDLGKNAVFLHHDVRSEDEWQGMVKEAESRFGKLDILVNNAGILQFGTLTHDTSLDDYMRLIEINQVGPFLGMKTAIPALMRNRGGSIVNISSTNGFAGYGGTIAYTASKFAVRGISKTAALE